VLDLTSPDPFGTEGELRPARWQGNDPR
jgi:hypothetical protein